MYVIENDERPAVRKSSDGELEQIADAQGNPVTRVDRAGVDTIRDRLRDHARLMGGPAPVVFIDYLQILRPDDPTGRKSDKQNMDETVSELRRISKTYQAPIIAISSLNRAAYGQAIGMESFKESGAIEYSSDILMGLDPWGLESGDTSAANKRNAETFQAFRDSAEKDLELVILKNRMGALGRIRMKLDALHGLYSEVSEPDGDGPEDWGDCDA